MVKEIKYDKLVRDKIPNIIETSGKICVSRIADEKEYRTKILEKVQEELMEFKSTPNTEEAADILEIVYALFNSYQLDINEIERSRLEKLNKRGGFEDRIILEKVIEK